MSEIIQVADADQLAAEIKDVRDNATESDWLVLGYTDNLNTIGLVAKGTGGLAEAAANFDADQARFALIRYFQTIDQSRTTKFCFVDWTPEEIPGQRKALVSTHKGQIQKLIGQYHVDLKASDRSDLDENVIWQKIMASSGQANYVLADDAKREHKQAEAKKQTNLVPSFKSVLEFEDEGTIRAAIADVRSDSSDTDWMLVGYGGSQTLKLIGSGTGGLDALLAACEDGSVFYGMIRTTETFDSSQTVKFSFITFYPESSIPPIRRGQINTHQGSIKNLFSPYHYEFSTENKTDLTMEVITQKIRGLMGTKSHVLEQRVENKVATERKVQNLVPTQGSSIGFEDEEALRSVIKAVRNDTDPTTWCLVGHLNDSTLRVLGSGTGGYDEMKQLFEANSMDYGLLRVTDQIDDSTTIKFVLVIFQDQNMPAMKKARITTQKGAVADVFRPYHLELYASTPDELSQNEIESRVGDASGSRSKVRP